MPRLSAFNRLSALRGAAGLGRTIKVGAEDADYTTIAAALAAATSGDTVLITPGTYTEYNKQIPVGVNVRGFGQDTILTSGSGSGGIFRPLGNNVIADLSITHTKTSSGGWALASLAADQASLDGKTVTVENCNLTGNFDSVSCNAGSWTFRNCKLNGAYTGVELAALSGTTTTVTFVDCQFTLTFTNGATGGKVFIRQKGTTPASGKVNIYAYGCSLAGVGVNAGASFNLLYNTCLDTETTNYVGVGNSWSWNLAANPSPVVWFRHVASTGADSTLDVYSRDERFTARSATKAKLFEGVDVADRLVFRGGNAGTLMDAVTGTTNAVFGYHPDGADYGVLEEYVDFTGHTEAWKALSTAIPAGSVIISVQANVDTALTTGGTTAHLIIGDHTAVATTYGVSNTLTKNSQITTQIAQAALTELGASTTLEVVGATAADNALGDTDITAGKVFVRIVYKKTPSIRTAV